MRNPNKAVISTLALMGLAALTFSYAVEHAVAKTMTRCQVKHSYCSERCIMNSNLHASDSMSQAAACIARTCDHQHKGCGPESYTKDTSGTGGKAGKTGSAKRVVSPASGGLGGPVRGGVGVKPTAGSAKPKTGTATPQPSAAPTKNVRDHRSQ